MNGNRMMRNLYSIIYSIGKLLLAGCVAVAIMSGIVFLYQYVGVRLTDNSGATDYHYGSHAFTANMEEGFSFIRMDANGYNNPTRIENPDILVMGSSHMEGREVAQNECVSAVLQNNLSNYSVYNIGMSAHDIYHTVSNFDAAVNSYAPSFVIIETSRVSLDETEMDRVIQGTYPKLRASAEGILHYLSMIPCVPHMHSQLNAWMANDTSEGDDGSVLQSDHYEETLRQFLTMLKKENIRVIIFYHPYESIQADGSLVWLTNQSDLELFAKTCSNLDISFVDMTEPFQEMYEENRILAHGFSNGAVGKGHLNKYGHNLIAEALLEIIMEGNNDSK